MHGCRECEMVQPAALQNKLGSFWGKQEKKNNLIMILRPVLGGATNRDMGQNPSTYTLFPVPEEDRTMLVDGLEALGQEELLYDLLLQFLTGCTINQNYYMQRQRRKAEVLHLCVLNT